MSILELFFGGMVIVVWHQMPSIERGGNEAGTEKGNNWI